MTREPISIQQAEDIILGSLTPIGTETIQLADAHLRTLRETLHTDRPAPPFNRAMMDGICLNSKNPQTAYPIAATQPAGTPALELTDPTTCIEIMTGAPLPFGTDCIIQIEHLTIENQTAHLTEEATIKSGQHIHPEGSDAPANHPILTQGTLLCPNSLATAASSGHHTLTVSKLPNIQILTTGDEVIPYHQTPLPHQIRRSHPSALTPLITHKKLGTVTQTHLPDDPEQIKSALTQSLKTHDILILTGGISKGKFDHIAPILTELLGPPHFHGVLQKPGKPLAYWKTKNSPAIFALPGNPVSVIATATRYLLPALKHLAHQTPNPQTAPLQTDFQNPSPLPTLIPYTIKNGHLHLHPPKNSGDYLTLTNTQGLTQLPKPKHLYPAGTPLEIFPY